MKVCLMFVFSIMLVSALGNEMRDFRKDAGYASDHPTLPIGSPAPPFTLPGTDGKT
ncbi:MAG TPA: hypothetical protein VHT72_08425 [Puia sp.]|nr:hypothetical protein [Puia sp.]